jgi:sec-independent protein translocase protein TatA
MLSNSRRMAFLYNIQGGQLVLIIVVLLVLFGSKRLPEIAKSLGKAVHEFRKAATDASVHIPETTAPAQHMAQTPPCASAPSAPAPTMSQDQASRVS